MLRVFRNRRLCAHMARRPVGLLVVSQGASRRDASGRLCVVLLEVLVALVGV